MYNQLVNESKMKQVYYHKKQYWLYMLLWLLSAAGANAQYSSDLGYPAYSTLTWDHISSIHIVDQSDAAIGLTKDGRMYTWGGNLGYTIHANISATTATDKHISQLAPFFVKSPAGEIPIKVRVAATSPNSLAGNYGGFNLPTYFCLTASGKMYAWGINNGIAGNNLATFPVVTSLPSYTDTTKAKRSPILMTNIGESTFVDMEFSKTLGYGIVIGSSGAAYHIGVSDAYGTFAATFAAIPLPSGVGSGFKYTNVWVSDYNTMPLIYLKGNDGNIYFTGVMNNNYNSGIPALYPRPTAPTLTGAETNGTVRSINPRLVPFPAGESIISINIRSKETYDNTYAIGSSGKAYVTGAWRFAFARAGGAPGLDWRQYVVAPIKTAPTAGQVEARFVNSGNIDSVYTLKQFTEIAMPPGVTSVISILGGTEQITTNLATLMVGNNNKVYWSGTGYATQNITDLTTGNFLQLSSSGAPDPSPDRCNTVQYARSNSYYSWLYEAINYQGAVKLFRSSVQDQQLGIISTSGRGYFVGVMTPNTAPGKVMVDNGRYFYTSIYPVPIANELLLSCNSSPGTGGPGLGTTTPTTSGTATIDCSKTQLAPAPKAGVASQTDLIITMTVSATGTFPVSVTGSGMSLANGVANVTATKLGTQQFHIPLNYDGTALGSLQFTIGTATNAGSCTADLTQSPKQTITNVWTLDCVPTVGPPLK